MRREASTPSSAAARRRHRIALAARYATLVLMLVVMLGPIVWQFLTSVRGRTENVYDGVLPARPTLDNYVRVAESFPLLQYVGNTLTVAVLAIASNMLFAAMGGYALSRAGWKGRRIVFTVLVATLMFPFESVMISMFLTVREMGLVDTLIGVWLPGAVSVLNIMIMRAAFLAVPREVEEAAVLDGAGEWTRFTRVFLPAAKGALAVVCITSFMGAWDDFLWPLLVLTDSDHYTLQLGLKTLAGATTVNDQRLVAAGAMAALVPMMLLFFALQRFFFKGVGEGAVKI
ncbi:carbohydrate ABC transporter permease [Streptomyces virginiae]|uniref:carbohydrate ABC transporter permease n=1 Tax=Streptomyces virginiae TaxID=1961 RepID=UPI00052544AF|nr:carbohydrate ABC transporter permease [Streptomyces virginiae]MCX4718385.1 carbohydrate ABC transporter permease [Streptomyces virginiae]MCX5275135.1 carbohydrate ABC transporter permease [Streptomyces virginiae]WSC80950.1 carbohydrate ABC transporter permease [Streptomyces virginiae]